MRYFEFNIKLKDRFDSQSKEGQEVCDAVSEKCADYCSDDTGFSVYISSFNGYTCRFVLSGNGFDNEMYSEGERFWESLGISGEVVEHKEIISDKVFKIMRSNSDIINHNCIEELMKLDSIRSNWFEESIVEPIPSSELRKIADIRYIPELNEEADRIDKCHTDQFVGHPVHYTIEDSNEQSFDNVVECLIGCLFTAKRLESRRVMILNRRLRFHSDSIDDMYENMYGGTIIFPIGHIEERDAFASSDDEIIELVCKSAVKHKNEVLTVFHIGRHDINAVNIIEAYLNDELTLIHLKEDLMSKKKSVEYICRLADEKNIADKSELIGRLNIESDKYYASDLDKIFSDYYSEYLRAVIYPAYFSLKKSVKHETRVEGSSADKLNKMIGLESVKKVIFKTVSFFKLIAMYKERGINMNMPTRSMLFTGNPGTAKTTVARLAAKIFKDNGLIASGNVVEVGRADLVAMYTGQTAPKVREAFKKAKDSILFIDEAYSLVEGKEGIYGDEAINTIVQEMENRREDTIVIFAGYPDKMEEFMQKNPGLRSRIAFHVDFPDYNMDELFEILRFMVEEKSMTMSEDAEAKVKMIFAEAVKRDDFGNGRFVRNLLEQAIMSLAERLMNKSSNMISDYELTTLIASDFVMPELSVGKSTNKIGF